MNKVISFRLPDPPEPETVQRIRKASRLLTSVSVFLCFGMCSYILAGLLALFLYEGPLFRIDDSAVYVFFSAAEIASEPQTQAISDLPLHTRLGMSVILLLQYAPIAIILWLLRRLFARLVSHSMFAAEHGRILMHIGMWLMFFAVIPVFTDMIAGYVGSPDRNWFKYSSIGALLLGALLMFLAQVMRHGSQMEQENASFL